MFQFQRAQKSQAKLRMALIGPSGSGKTYTALAVATRLGERVAVIDTEHGSASKYADQFGFDVLNLGSFAPMNYVAAIQAAVAAGYDVVVIDSLSHAWSGKDGALEQVDKRAAASRTGNSYTAWRDVTPMHNALIDAIVGCKAHVIATMRSKTEYVLQEDERGKKVPRKVGMAPIQRDGMEYEFDVVGDMDYDNRLVVTKSRCPALSGHNEVKPGEQLAATLKAWLEDGVPVPVTKAQAVAERVGGIGEEIDAVTLCAMIAEAKDDAKLQQLVAHAKVLPEADKPMVRRAFDERRKMLAEVGQ